MLVSARNSLKSLFLEWITIHYSIMTNIVISSEMRVGSRWMHYTLKDLYGMKASPEIGRKSVKKDPEEAKAKVHEYFMNGRIAKFHGLTPRELAELLPESEFKDYKTLFIVRNPRDRGVSFGFHHLHEKGYGRWKGLSDKEVIKKTFTDSKEFTNGNDVIVETMQPDRSIFYAMKEDINIPYVWTTYEWLIEDPHNQVTGMNMYFEEGAQTYSDSAIDEAIRKNSFSAKTGNRELGDEDRKDTWRRKGIVGDWMNHFDGELFDASKLDWDVYWSLVELGRNMLK